MNNSFSSRFLTHYTSAAMVVVFGVIGMPQIALANPINERMQQCMNEENSLLRLACFERIAAENGIVRQTQGRVANNTDNERIAELLEKPVTNVKEDSTAITQIISSSSNIAEKTAAPKSTTLSATAGISTAPADTKTDEETVETFGLKDKDKPESYVEDDKLFSVVKSVDELRDGRIHVRLVDGQLWEIGRSERRRSPDEGDNVVIEKGWLGSHFMKTVGTTGKARVKRIR